MQYSVMARGRDLNDPGQLAALAAMGINEDESDIIEVSLVLLILFRLLLIRVVFSSYLLAQGWACLTWFAWWWPPASLFTLIVRCSVLSSGMRPFLFVPRPPCVVVLLAQG